MIAQEPDRAVGVFSLGPRMLIAAEDLDRTGLVRSGQPWCAIARCFACRRDGTEAFKAQLAASMPRHRRPHHHLCAGTTRSPPLLGSSSPCTWASRGSWRQGGGIGVAVSVRAFVRQKLATIAILSVFGADSRQVIAIYCSRPRSGASAAACSAAPRQRAASRSDALPDPPLADRARRRHLAARHRPGPARAWLHPALRPLADARDQAGSRPRDPEARRSRSCAGGAPWLGLLPIAAGLAGSPWQAGSGRSAGSSSADWPGAPGAWLGRAAVVAMAAGAGGARSPGARRGQSPPPGQPRARRARPRWPRRDDDRRRRAPRVQLPRAARDEERRERACLLLIDVAARPGAGLRAARGRPGRATAPS